MRRTLAISFLSFPFSVLAFLIGWAARDLRTGLLAGAAVFTVFFAASLISLAFIRSYEYWDALLPPVFSVLWSLALAPFSFGASLFSAPAFIAAGTLLGACMAMAKYYGTGLKWLWFPAVVFLYEMLPLNIPGQFDDIFALAGSGGYTLSLLLKKVLPHLLRDVLGRLGGRGR
jgi:hypothetical protein